MVVLFDLDGTLLDTSSLIMKSLQHSITSTNSDPGGLEDFIWGRPLRDVLAEICPGRETLAFRAYQEHYRDYRHLVTPFPGIVEALHRLENDDHIMGVVTTKGTLPAREDLDRYQLRGMFRVLVGFDDVSRPKPHPEPVEKALKELGAGAGDAIMIGDTPGDVGAGQAAGTLTGGVLWGPDTETLLRQSTPDVYFTHPGEIVDWCRRWREGP